MPATTRDRSIADAMDEVLAAERESVAAVRAAEDAAHELQRATDELRRRILDTARRRATRLHEEMQRRLAVAVEALTRADRAADVEPPALDDLAGDAARRVARALTSLDDAWR